MKQEFLEVGQITSTHGIMGEMRVQPWADSPEFLCRFDTLYVGPTHWPIKVERARVHKNMVILKLEGITDVPGAVAMRNQVLHVARKDVKLPKGVYFDQELLGLTARNAATGETLGTVEEVMNYPAHKVYAIRGGKDEYLVPAVPAFIQNIDIQAGTIDIHVWEGLGSHEN